MSQTSRANFGETAIYIKVYSEQTFWNFLWDSINLQFCICTQTHSHSFHKLQLKTETKICLGVVSVVLYSETELRGFQDKKCMFTTFQSMMNAKLSLHSFWLCHQIGAHQDDSNDIPQSACEFQVGFPSLWIRITREAILKLTYRLLGNV